MRTGRVLSGRAKKGARRGVLYVCRALCVGYGDDGDADDDDDDDSDDETKMVTLMMVTTVVVYMMTLMMQ